MDTQDTTTVLNPGTGGDSMDESAITDTSGAVIAKRPRVVFGGEATRRAVVEPELVDPQEWAMPVKMSAHTHTLLTDIRDELREMNKLLRKQMTRR